MAIKFLLKWLIFFGHFGFRTAASARGVVLAPNYPKKVYSHNNNNSNDSARITLERLDQIVYGNFVLHCNGNPDYSINADERYVIQASLPNAFSAIIDSKGTLFEQLITKSCSFSLTGPEGKYLRLVFLDPDCDNWPPGCSLKILDGKASQQADNQPELLTLTSGGRNKAKNCTVEIFSFGNAVSFEIASNQLGPNPRFNFTVAVVVSSHRGLTSSPDFALAAIAIGIAVLVVVVVLSRMFCCKNECCSGQCALVGLLCCCRRSKQQIATIHVTHQPPNGVQEIAVDNTIQRSPWHTQNAGPSAVKYRTVEDETTEDELPSAARQVKVDFSREMAVISSPVSEPANNHLSHESVEEIDNGPIKTSSA